ncbi:bifunctional DNA-formamidopyrimidine glycosylase/DNA-(apurinic or apyrimidinic site) lyase [Acuticoccus sp. M5D2P5]|uniref:bifunctional DNA-formamidopyrimidine glycosylase/DNA-(apurinic or apyrimidinic site) lyase n=1 Tax=Acuticoccus kalidii TaxID=2910977 RepID=UPI001F1CAE5D|nr:bifunctional DNA-formamidopyrimidine glycosylase/DNA-(apurinic or apyrimidinic site) lyase [Acuticoccus kalidii]MCF3935509.1 bifunctional DNA-formamidopyrimidine glycosylase/DNA-(apurinic or apyrimidinic site) lyase [Acuticoccus kalidii]
MPELPEVETVRRGLAPVMEGAVIDTVHLARADLRFPFPERFAERLEGRRIDTLGRRAKYLVGALDDGTALIAHLGMSGAFRVEGGEPIGAMVFPRSKKAAHDHVTMALGERRIIYNDPRRFGFMTLAVTADLDAHPYFAHLGMEPMPGALTADRLAAALAGKAAPLKAALLDQRVIAGLGNIYVCEALWRARLSPKRLAGSIVRRDGSAGDRVARLTAAILSVIEEAILAGGSSLRDYVAADGSLGRFQHTFAVYGREGEPCPRPACDGVVKRIVQSGRSTFYCPQCQR